MEHEHPPETEVKKPEVLYHASHNAHIMEFEPRNEKMRSPLDGPAVFATPDKAYAACFLVATNDSWVKIGRWTHDSVPGPWRCVISNRDRFTQADQGGAIYSLPSTTFAFHADRNMGDIEWTSPVPVTPAKTEHYESGLIAMQSLGVEVYFVDDQTFQAINMAADHGEEIIDHLTLEPAQ